MIPGSKKEIEKLSDDHGAIIRNGTKMIAAYKNNSGEMEYMSAVCPHLAGIVNWSNAEKSWDCPCHGSRFDCHGKIIEGPAISGLKPLNSKFEEIKITKRASKPKKEVPPYDHLSDDLHL